MHLAASLGAYVNWGWLDKGFERLSELHNPLLTQLVPNGRLKLRFPESEIDSVDTHSAALIGAALATHTSLCVVLPDTKPRRPAFLFAYSLLGSWARLKSAGVTQQRPVLYCGVRPGIRDQLTHVAISGLGVTLDGIFDQVHLSRGATASDRWVIGDQGLPGVFTAFSPGNARSLIDKLKPSFVAIDLAEASKADWLAELLSATKQHGISVVAWSTNPLSDALTKFAQSGYLVKWPMCRSYGGLSQFGQNETAESLFQPFITTAIQPVVMAGASIREHDINVRAAIDCLRTLGGGARGSLIQSAIKLHWRLLRTVESLAVPFAFHEAEATHIWGVRPIATLRQTCAHFQSSVRNFDVTAARELEKACLILDEVITVLKQMDPPLWSALTRLIHSEPPDGHARLVVFPSQSRKELFLLALLAKLNITPTDLEPFRTWITTLAELQFFADHREQLKRETSLLSIPDCLELVPLFVGVPTIGQTSRLLPFFFSEDAELLIHGYQQGLMAPCVNRWEDGLSPNVAAISDAIDFFAARPKICNDTISLQRRLTLVNPTRLAIDLKDADDTLFDKKEELWASQDLKNEIGYLFEEDEESGLSQDVSGDGESSPADESLSVDEALRITFSGGWGGVFAREQKINFVSPDTRKVEERFVRALRQGDTVLIIPSQPRQSLYALIISRVHQHPSIELHLALLRRWREDLQAGYQRWARSRSDPLGQLLQELQNAGSSVTSTLALRFWLTGATLCPGDPDDLLRAAEILNLTFVRSRYRQIGHAASRIRGLHRGLSNRLNRWLNDQARGIADSHDAEVIDSTLGLTFGDLRSSLIVAEVVSIREVTGPFLRDTLGFIERVVTDDTARAIA